MRGLTLTNPWAIFVPWREKRIETRSWGTAYRGPLAVHAAKGYPRDIDVDDWIDRSPAIRVMHEHQVHALEQLPHGAIVAVVTLVQLFRFDEDTERKVRQRSARGRLPRYEADFGNFSPGRYGWVFDHVIALETPVPCRGAQGLWPVPIDVVGMVTDQLRRMAA